MWIDVVDGVPCFAGIGVYTVAHPAGVNEVTDEVERSTVLLASSMDRPTFEEALEDLRANAVPMWVRRYIAADARKYKTIPERRMGYIQELVEVTLHAFYRRTGRGWVSALARAVAQGLRDGLTHVDRYGRDHEWGADGELIPPSKGMLDDIGYLLDEMDST